MSDLETGETAVAPQPGQTAPETGETALAPEPGETATKTGCLEALGWVKDQVVECVKFWTPLGFTAIILWLLYRPDRFHPSIDSAVLSALQPTLPAINASSSSSDQSLRYDLAVRLSLHNSHSRLIIRYLDISATAFYNGNTRLGPSDDAFPTPFRQGPKNTTVLHSAFHGTVAVNSDVVAELERELAAGTVHVRLRVSLTLMYKVWPITEFGFYDYDCWLWFSPPHDADPAVMDAAGTRCWAAK